MSNVGQLNGGKQTLDRLKASRGLGMGFALEEGVISQRTSPAQSGMNTGVRAIKLNHLVIN